MNSGNHKSGQLTSDQTREEWLVTEILVVLLKMLSSWADQLGSYQLVTSLLKAGDDVSDQTSLDTIWLNCNETVNVWSG